MSLQWKLSREVPEDTAAVGRAILRPDNVYRQIGDHFDELFPDEGVFAPMYCDTGRGAIPPLLAALVTVFQMLEKVPDRQGAEMVGTRIDWKYALHLPLTYAGFHFTDLYAFRVRLVEHGQELAFFEEILARLRALGLIKRRGKARTDATHILAVVQRLSQLELITEALRVGVEAATRVAPDWVERELPPAFRDRYSGRQSEYGLSDTEVKAGLAEASKNAFWFLEKVDRTAPKVVRELAEVETLRVVCRQQFPEGPGRPPAKRPTGSDVIETPHETEARYAVKRGQPWQGYKMQVTETCDDDRPHLIVDLEPTGALDNDSPELPKIQERLAQRDVLPGEQYTDQAYVSAGNLVRSAERGINLMGVPPADTQGRQGFHQADFAIDEAGQTAVCPAGQRSTVRGRRKRGQDSSLHTQLRFDGRVCQRCPFFGQCTKSLQGRSLTLHPHRLVLYQRRAEAATEEFQQRMHVRAGAEATISELTRGHGLRNARYRGAVKLRLQAGFTGVAVNLKRTFRWLSQQKPVAGPAGDLLGRCTTAIAVASGRPSGDQLRLDSTYLIC